MYTPNPIIFLDTPAEGMVLAVGAGRGGLAGYILLGQEGTAATVEVSADGGGSWAAPAFPHTLADGEQLRLTRTGGEVLASTLLALVPLDEGATPDGGGGSGPVNTGGDALVSGVPITNISAKWGNSPSNWIEPIYTAEIPPGTTFLTVTIAGGVGDRDIGARYGAPDVPPEINSIDDPAGTDHTFTLPDPQAGTWFIYVNDRFEAPETSGATLTAWWGGAGGGND